MFRAEKFIWESGRVSSMLAGITGSNMVVVVVVVLPKAASLTKPAGWEQVCLKSFELSPRQQMVHVTKYGGGCSILLPVLYLDSQCQ